MPRLSREALVAYDLKASRESRGLTQVVIADLLCTTQASIARWEKSGGMPAMARKLWEYHWVINKEAVVDIPANKTKGAKPLNTKAKRIDVKAQKTVVHAAKKAKGELRWQKNLRKRRRGLTLVVSNEAEPERDETDGEQEETI